MTEVGDLTEFFHGVASEGTPEEALAAFYAYESQVPRVAETKARGLREMYGANEKTCGYFTLHTTADVFTRECGGSNWQASRSESASGRKALAGRRECREGAVARAGWD